MRFFSSLVRPDESTGAVMRWVHRIWVFFWLTVLGAGIGLLSLYLTAHSYASIDATALLQSYFKIPLLVAMNLLAPILLVYLGFFLFARPWAAYLLSALPFFTLALASYYKVQLRGDPVLATDLRLIRTAGGIMGNYTFEISAPVIVVLEGFVLIKYLSVSPIYPFYVLSAKNSCSCQYLINALYYVVPFYYTPILPLPVASQPAPLFDGYTP